MDSLRYNIAMQTQLTPNTDKLLTREYNGTSFARLPIKTKTILPEDNLETTIVDAVTPHMLPGDTLVISEKIVAITQGRAFPIDSIHPSLLARILVRFVHKSPYGIGLGSPWTMELAIREVGAIKILFASVISAVGKVFGVRGLFYKIVGNNINAIDGPCDYTIPPFNKYAKLGPKNPDNVAEKLSVLLKLPIVIIDANDIGVNILGVSDTGIDRACIAELFRDNPLGQKSESTPLCLVRKM